MKKVRSLLVIDDDSDDFELIAEAVQQIDENISVHFLDKCEDGNKYKGHVFDLVFLDINMPHHDGFSWLKGIRANGYENLPIVMYTNSGHPEHISRAYRDGANLYYIKPASFSDLFEGLRLLINLDWSNPLSIKETYWQNEYDTFKVA